MAKHKWHAYKPEGEPEANDKAAAPLRVVLTDEAKARPRRVQIGGQWVGIGGPIIDTEGREIAREATESELLEYAKGDTSGRLVKILTA